MLTFSVAKATLPSLAMGVGRTHQNDRLQGTLDLLVLKILAARGPMHGYGLALQIEELSRDTLRLEEGSLYPALHRLTRAGALRSEWGASENNRRARFYSISPAGRQRLAHEEESWTRLTDAIARVLRYA